jgi:hypothetical protein
MPNAEVFRPAMALRESISASAYRQPSSPFSRWHPDGEELHVDTAVAEAGRSE